MLIRFSFENWRSFRDKAVFSLIAGEESQHDDRVPRLPKYEAGVLPVTVVYGGNASGKSNLFKALVFAQRLVGKGNQHDAPIPAVPFLLSVNGEKQPSRFCFELLADETIYEFSFAVTRKAVLEEKLVRIIGTDEETLYTRRNKKIRLGNSLDKNKHLEFISQSTPDNQLFLTTSVFLQAEKFQPVYDWFKGTLRLISPNARYGPFGSFFEERSPLHQTMNDILEALDTGIVRLGGEEVPLDRLPLSEEDKARVLAELKENEGMSMTVPSSNERFIITRRGGKLGARQAIAYHDKEDGEQVLFDFREESDGSQRLIDLLPAFIDLVGKGSKGVYFIDEIDRSLHTQLIRYLLECYLSSCSPKTRGQLLLTTHDLMLMDRRLLRRDEMWATERSGDGASSLIAFSDYQGISDDADIRKLYLQGRMGGTPQLPIDWDLPTP